MTKQEKLTYRILASLYPDRRPSEIRKIIDDALSKEERKDDMELWMALTRETVEKKETKDEQPSTEKIIERHYYHEGWWKPYYTSTITGTAEAIPCVSKDSVIISCSGTDTWTTSSATLNTSDIFTTEMN